MKDAASEVLLVFLRWPEPGRAKTRLIPLLGAEGAAELYRRLAERALAEARALERPGLARAAFLEPPGRVEEARSWLGPSFEALPQAGGDLGERLSAAFAWAFARSAARGRARGGARGSARGGPRVVAMGTDCLDLDAPLLAEAFETLAARPAVLGPALDGGYYLLGLSRPVPEAFQGIPWSTGETLAASRERLERAGAPPALLRPLRDLDTPEDLEALRPRWGEALGLRGGGPPGGDLTSPSPPPRSPRSAGGRGEPRSRPPGLHP